MGKGTIIGGAILVTVCGAAAISSLSYNPKPGISGVVVSEFGSLSSDEPASSRSVFSSDTYGIILESEGKKYSIKIRGSLFDDTPLSSLAARISSGDSVTVSYRDARSNWDTEIADNLMGSTYTDLVDVE